jgi:hypothetical protein
MFDIIYICVKTVFILFEKIAIEALNPLNGDFKQPVHNGFSEAINV